MSLCFAAVLHSNRECFTVIFRPGRECFTVMPRRCCCNTLAIAVIFALIRTCEGSESAPLPEAASKSLPLNCASLFALASATALIVACVARGPPAAVVEFTVSGVRRCLVELLVDDGDVLKKGFSLRSQTCPSPPFRCRFGHDH